MEKAINEVLKGLAPSSESLICDFGIEEQNRALETQGKVPKVDPKQVPIVGETITYVVAAVIINEHGEVLMMQEAKKSCAGKWYLPAGRLERGEDIETATKREVLEETGLQIKCTSLIMVDSGKGVWFRFVLVGDVIGGTLKSPSSADQESLQAKWIQNLDEVPLRAQDILPLIDRAREYKMAKNAGDRSWHSDILPSLTPHTRAYLRLVVLIRKKRNNKVHVLLSERTTWHLPVCEINQAKSVHSTLHAFMVEIFGADVASHRPHGILAVEFDSKNSNGGFCMTLLVGFKVALEDVPIIGKYMWHETNQQLGDLLATRISMKNSTIVLNVIS